MEKVRSGVGKGVRAYLDGRAEDGEDAVVVRVLHLEDRAVAVVQA